MSESMPVRTAIAADLPALHALIESGYRGDSARRGWTHEADLIQGQRTDIESLAAILNDSTQRILVLEEAGTLIGCVNITNLGDGRAYLGLLCVAPERQAEGVGKSLIKYAEICAFSQFDASVMEMTVIERRPELIAYYERRGYARTGERRPLPPAPEFDLLVLERPIR